jgi:hypothetical protein
VNHRAGRVTGGHRGAREVWAGVGLLRDELSTTVLALGLPGDAVSATGRGLGRLAGRRATSGADVAGIVLPCYRTLRVVPAGV